MLLYIVSCLEWLYRFWRPLKVFKTIVDDPFWFRLELLTNRHETETMQHMQRLVRPGMCILDIGAHVGYYSRMFSRQAGDTGKVVAFEPHPRTHEVLKKNVAHLPNVTTLQIAVAEQEGTADLYDYLMMSASGSLHYDKSLADLQRTQMSKSDVAPRHDAQFQMQKYIVRTVPIDKCMMGYGDSTGRFGQDGYLRAQKWVLYEV